MDDAPTGGYLYPTSRVRARRLRVKVLDDEPKVTVMHPTAMVADESGVTTTTYKVNTDRVIWNISAKPVTIDPRRYSPAGFISGEALRGALSCGRRS